MDSDNDALDIGAILRQWERSVQAQNARLEEHENQGTDGLCEHEYVLYVGFRETFHYCRKCDQKIPVEK